MLHRTFALPAFVIACFATHGASAQQQSPDMLAAGCTSCHGTDGHSSGKIPSIAGMERTAFVDAMKSFRSGERQGTVMKRIATGYSDAQIDALATYFSARRGKR